MKQILKSLFLGIMCIGLSVPALAQEPASYNSVAERFAGSDETSKTKIDHYPLSYYLNEVVLFVGRSTGFLGNEKPDAYRNSHIKVAYSLLPSRYENSRIFFHELTDTHKTFFKDYQAGLERIAEARDIRTLNKNEQLAYWLNLYNVIVLNKLIEDYPTQSLKSYRGADNGDNFWSQKTTVVGGVPLSLLDIEKILFNNYDSPLVAFGLWQGSIGGPRLRKEAYESDNVWQALENNATEFVNSNRGLRPPRGNKLKVSEFYEWVKPAFGGTDDAVLGFIKRYADPNFVTGVQKTTEVSYSLYDYQIADVLGGSLHTGLHNQLGGVLTGKSGNAGDVGAGGAIGGLMDVYNMFDAVQRKGGVGQVPEGFYKLLLGMRQNTRRPIPLITTEECAPDESCEASNPEA